MAPHIDNEVPAEERLFCLLLALLPAERGMAKSDIFKNVRGYREDYLKHGATDALNKKFDRDKDELKSMGIPLRTSDTENPADAVYSISADEYKLFEVSDAEVSLLTAAAAMWKESAHSAEANQAQLRLLAADSEIDKSFEINAPRIRTLDPAYSEIADAVSSQSVISFSYLKPGDFKATLRLLSPAALVNYNGSWYVSGFDHNRGENRTFLLSRIVGKVTTTTNEKYANSEVDSAGALLSQLEELWDSLSAKIRVKSGSKAAVVLLNRKGTKRIGEDLEVHYLDANQFADELCEFGDEALVIEPADLRELVISKLETLVSDHG